MKRLLPTACVILIVLSTSLSGRANEPAEPDSYKGKTVMAIFAHPDDETVTSPVLAKYARLGANVYLVIATDGSKGVEPHANIPAGEQLAKARAGETLCATKALEIDPPIMLGYPDGELALWDNIFSLDDKIDALFKQYQPDVVITWGSDGGYGHPDHRMVSNIVTEVFQRGESEKIKNLLYVGYLKEELDSAPELKTGQAKWYKDTFKTTRKDFLTYRISFDKQDQQAARKALGCHESQFTPDVVDEVSVLLGHDLTTYFRPWRGFAKVRTDIFK